MEDIGIKVLQHVSNNTYCKGSWDHKICDYLTNEYLRHNRYSNTKMSDDCIIVFLQYILKCDDMRRINFGSEQNMCSSRYNFRSLIDTFLTFDSFVIFTEILKIKTLTGMHLHTIQKIIEQKYNTNINIINAFIQHVPTIPISVLKHVEINYDTLKIICENKNTNDELFLFAFSQKIPIYNDLLNIVVLNRNSERLKILVNYGYVLTNTHLEYACRIKSEKMIKIILDNKIKPTSKCINELLFDDNNLDDTDENDTITEIINLLTSYGYVLTYDDVTNITKKKHKINNIKKYNIKFDDKFMTLCSNIHYFPYDYEEIDIKFGISDLQYQCGRSYNSETIKKMIEEYQIVPDTICLENACKVKNNISVISYLIKNCHVPPTMQCIKNYNYHSGCNVLSTLCEYIPNDIVFNIARTPIAPPCSTVKNIKKKKDDMKVKVIEEQPIKSIVIPEPINIIKTIDIPQLYTNLKKRKLYTIITSAKKILKLEKKKTVSFIKIRSNLLDYIKEKQLSTKNTIKLDTELASLTNKELNTYISYTHLDNLVHHMIKI